MSLDGLRAWIGEVERKLGMRTRVFLVLTVIAIGCAGAAIYLAVEASDSAVNESDVQALQEDLEAQIGKGGGGAAGLGAAQLEAELKALQAEVAELKGESGAAQNGKGASTEGGAGEAGGSSGGGSSGGAGSEASGGSPSSAKLRELFEQAKEKAEEGK
jgi:hypothetical protein